MLPVADLAQQRPIRRDTALSCGRIPLLHVVRARDLLVVAGHGASLVDGDHRLPLAPREVALQADEVDSGLRGAEAARDVQVQAVHAVEPRHLRTGTAGVAATTVSTRLSL